MTAYNTAPEGYLVLHEHWFNPSGTAVLTPRRRRESLRNDLRIRALAHCHAESESSNIAPDRCPCVRPMFAAAPFPNRTQPWFFSQGGGKARTVCAAYLPMPCTGAGSEA